jgi:hypothetical protein
MLAPLAHLMAAMPRIPDDHDDITSD